MLNKICQEKSLLPFQPEQIPYRGVVLFGASLAAFPLLFIKPPDKRGELPYNLK